MRVMAAEQLAEFKQAFAASVVHRRLTAAGRQSNYCVA